jgi:hypothetical protein
MSPQVNFSFMFINDTLDFVLYLMIAFTSESLGFIDSSRGTKIIKVLLVCFLYSPCVYFFHGSFKTKKI